MLASTIASTSNQGSFANGYAQGMFFNQDLQTAQSCGDGNAPLATATVIREKEYSWPNLGI